LERQWDFEAWPDLGRLRLDAHAHPRDLTPSAYAFATILDAIDVAPAHFCAPIVSLATPRVSIDWHAKSRRHETRRFARRDYCE
jgi:hypothetical protein